MRRPCTWASEPLLLPFSVPNSSKDKRVLYLDEINVIGVNKSFRVKIRLEDGDSDENVDLTGRGPRWTPSHICEVPITGSISVILKIGGWRLRKPETTQNISSQRISEEFLKLSGQIGTQGSSKPQKSSFSISENVMIGDESATMVLKFHPSDTSEATRQVLHESKVILMENCNRLKTSKTLQTVTTVLKFGVAASEANPIAKAAFSVAKVTLDLLIEQQKYDEQLSDLVCRIERVPPFLQKAEEVSQDDATLIKKVIEKLYNLLIDIAEFSHNYVHRGFVGRLAKSTISPSDRTMVDKLRAELDTLLEEFHRAIEIEILEATTVIDTKFLLKKLKPADAGYDYSRKCMEGTRHEVINRIVTWSLKPVAENPSQILWLYGVPGIGKTSLATSICSRLHTEKILGGSFFCRRDDPKLGDPQYVLPTLTYRLAEMWAPFRKLVAAELREDPQITPRSNGGGLLTRLLPLLKDHPPAPLVLVIDALDECGDEASHGLILKRVFDATSCVPWLKFIITSRQERDIDDFFQQPDRSPRCSFEDLATDEQVHEDIRRFTQERLSSIAAAKHIPGWVPEYLVNNIVTYARGLFIIVETLWQLVKDDGDPETQLNQALERATGDAVGDLRYPLFEHRQFSRCARQSQIQGDNGSDFSGCTLSAIVC